MLEKLFKDRAELVANMQALANKETLTDVETKEWDTVQAEISALDARIKRIQDATAARENGESAQAAAAQTPITQPLVGAPANTGVSDGEQRDLNNFSFLNVARAAHDPRTELNGLEAEMAQEAEKEARTSGVSSDSKAISIPQVVLQNSRIPRPVNTQTAGTPTSGGILISTEVRSPIEALYEKLNLVSLGATMLSGLENNIKMPRSSRSVQKPSEKGENVTSDKLTPSFTSFDLTPRRVAGHIVLSEQLLAQQSLAVEAWFRNHLLSEMAIEIESLTIADLLATTGLNILNVGGAPTRDTFIDMETRMGDNLAREGGWGYLLTRGVKGKLRKTKVDAGSGQFVIDRTAPGMLEDYPFAISDFLPRDGGAGNNEHTSILAKWVSLIMAQWGGMDMKADPYTGIKEDLITVAARTFFDTGVERPEEFEVVTGLDIS